MEMHAPICKNEAVQTLDVRGVQMGFMRRGEPSEGSALVLLHGFTGSAQSWSSLLNSLIEPGLQIVALDMLGHGQSSAPTDPARYSIEHCQADILAALQQLDIDPQRSILLGYSMGGRVALYTALSGNFRALILESASPGLLDPDERAQRRASDNALAERIEREGVSAFIDYWQDIPLFASQRTMPPNQRMLQRAQRLNNTAPGLANSLRGLGTGVQPALHNRLWELTLPVLLIAGELDPKFRAIAQQMNNELPNSKLAIVSGAGHTVHLEQPARFVELVSDFCTSVIGL